MSKKMEWDDKYSVGVEELDNQHKRMFNTINELLNSLETNTAEEHLGGVIESLIQYKMFHFATEEKYFEEFNYEGKDDHIAKHKFFNDKLEEMRSRNPNYNIEFGYELVDFLEDWLINHLMVTDQKYVECFHSHGLK